MDKIRTYTISRAQMTLETQDAKCATLKALSIIIEFAEIQ